MRLYKFVFFLLVAGALLGRPALADVVCVQQKLKDLGFNPGPVDGALGSRTVLAAKNFAANAGLGLPDLTEATTDSWCTALSSFSTSPQAKAIGHYDLAGEPRGVLPAATLRRLWNAYKTAKECFVFPNYDPPTVEHVDTLSAQRLRAQPWSSPFSRVTGAPACASTPAKLYGPAPIPVVKLDERYGERVPSVDIAETWFRRMATYVRYTDDPVAKSVLKKAILDWAEAGSLGKGIHVSWGKKPVDYQMMSAIVSILAATAELSDDFGPEERVVVGSWLNSLVKQSAASTWKDREDDKQFMRTYIALLWGLMVGDDEPVQYAIDTYKLAINDMRPDGSWPVDSQRGGMGIAYNGLTTNNVLLIAEVLHQARGIDLFRYSVDGRSIHDAVAFVVRSLRNPIGTNKIYAISCPGGGDRFGGVDHPNMHFRVEVAGSLLAYAELFPERESSAYIRAQFAGGEALDSEIAGGSAVCQFAAKGGPVTLPPLAAPPPPPPPEPEPVLPKPKVKVTTREEMAHETGHAIRVNSLLYSSFPRQKDPIGYNLKGLFSYNRNDFISLQLVLNEPVGDTNPPKALAACKVEFVRYEDNRPRMVISFRQEGSTWRAVDDDCFMRALPRRQARQAKLLLGSFRDLAIGVVGSGGLEYFQDDGLKIFLERVAEGEIAVAP